MVTIKLIYCDYCKSVIQLSSWLKYCNCGRSCGRYDDDGNTAYIWGDRCIPLGISNYSLANAASYYLFGECPSHTKKEGIGWLLDAFVYIPSNPVVRHLEVVKS